MSNQCVVHDSYDGYGPGSWDIQPTVEELLDEWLAHHEAEASCPIPWCDYCYEEWEIRNRAGSIEDVTLEDIFHQQQIQASCTCEQENTN